GPEGYTQRLLTCGTTGSPQKGVRASDRRAQGPNCDPAVNRRTPGVHAGRSCVVEVVFVRGAPNAFWSRLAALPTLFLQSGVEGLLRRGQVRPELEHLAEAGDGAVQVALPAEGVAQVEVGRGELRVESDGLAVARDGLVQPALRGQGNAEVVVGAGQVGS